MSSTSTENLTPDGQGTNQGSNEGAGTPTATTEVRTFNQDQLNEIVTSRLAEQSAKLTTKLQKEFDKQLADALTGRDAAIDTKLATLVTAALQQREVATARQSLASEYGLSDPQLAKLDGDTVEALRQSAETLFGAMKTKQAPVIVAGGAPSGNAPTFTRAQVSDTKFYQANKAEILRAGTEGRITG